MGNLKRTRSPPPKALMGSSGKIDPNGLEAVFHLEAGWLSHWRMLLRAYCLSFPLSIHSCFVIRLTSPGVGAELTGALVPTCFPVYMHRRGECFHSNILSMSLKLPPPGLASLSCLYKELTFWLEQRIGCLP